MNSVCIVGRITKDLELRKTQTGISAVSMFVAINNGKDKDGNKIPADFPKVYVYGKQAENVYAYCHKGSLIAVTGNIKTRTWDKDDDTRGYETCIKANRIQFLSTKQSDSNSIPEQETEYDPFSDFGDSIVIDDNMLE
ncbi:MAG TPA: single-stranded DNA-binding protein [Candidatus Coprosoma intestinipullorum]|uniref:Single-stranded DNA-binding protein n=1 Tax=Candidatus Coprosoma intestinipullorum TaxID=2840752 RepID=A0A9D1CZC7_9FIRM|nr:single-stranded DNA-binding protein [Candidatus Coprosoma intestinipullorum]